MEVKKIVRDSNYELLRVVSMFLIVLWHVIQHAGVLENTTGVTNIIFTIIKLLIIIHVNCFMLITGYYQSKSKFQLKKVGNLIMQVWFYNIIINTILYLSKAVQYNGKTEYFLKMLFFNLDTYWYLKCYFIVYLLSPFLNILIQAIKKEDFKKMIIVIFLCFSIIPIISLGLFYESNGSTVAQYIFLYFIGAYIRKYDLNNKYFKKFNIKKKRNIYISIFICCWITNVFMHYLLIYLNGIDNTLLTYITSYISMYSFLYNNPLIIIQAISMFLFFGTLSIKSKLINKISSLTLGVYLIHEMGSVYSWLYKWIGLTQRVINQNDSIIIEVFLWAIVIFTTCSLIELLRQILFKFLEKIKNKYNLSFLKYRKVNIWQKIKLFS